MEKLIIPKEELYQKYMVELLTQRDVARHFNTTVPTIWARCKEYGFKRPQELNYEIGKVAAMEYNQSHPEERKEILRRATEASKTPEARLKKSISATGRAHTEESKIKIGLASRKRMSDPLCKSQIIKSNHNRKGVPCKPSSNWSRHITSAEVQEKARQTLQLKYNVDNVFKSPEIQEQIRQTMKDQGFVSVGENELFTFIKGMCPDAIQGNYSVLKNKELDIYIPSLNIAFEYNGVYWHSDRKIQQDRNITFTEARNYHYKKYKDCLEQGVRLIMIWGPEWKYKSTIWKNKIRSILNYSQQETIFARKCTVSEIGSSVKNMFLEQNHIQGPDKAEKSFGLFYNSTLAAVMTFRKSRDNKETELSRYATAYNIPGGFSKLLKHSGYTNIISWSDNRLSGGELYRNNGWKQMAVVDPDYQVFYNGKLNHKSSFTRKQIAEKFPEIYSEDLTEWQMEDMIPHCYRLWDCGKIKWKTLDN